MYTFSRIILFIRIVLLIVEPGLVMITDLNGLVYSIDVTWEPPEEQTGPTNYSLTYCSEGGSECVADRYCGNKTVVGVYANRKKLND